MSTRVLRKRPARASSPSPSPAKPSTRKRVKVVHSDTESSAESSDDDDCSVYGEDGDDDDKENEPVTPRSQRIARRGAGAVTPTSTPRRGRTAARTPTKKTPTKRVVSASPTKRLAKLSLAPATNTLLTPPTTPPDEQPAKLTNSFTRARTSLRSDTRPEQLSGRDAERLELLAYLRSSSPKSLYISGQPGTGKTALIRETLAAYQEEEADWDGEVRKVYVNCVGRKEEAVWDAILELVAGDPLQKSPSKRKRDLDDSKGRGAFERWLGQSDEKCLLVLDEIDHLSTSSGVLASIFALPASHADILRVVAISNSHTLAVRSAGVATLHFEPYNAKAMAEIARSRLADSSAVFTPAALTMASSRVAGLTGDVRTLVAVLVRALDAAEAKGAPTVGPPHVLEAWKALAPKPVENKADAKRDIFMGPPSAPKPSAAAASTTTTNTPRVAVGLALQPKLALLALMVAKRRLACGLPLGVLAANFGSRAFARTPSFGSPSKRSTSPMKRSSSFACPSSRRAHDGLDTNALHAFYTAAVARSSPLGAVSRTEFADVLAVLEGCGAAHVLGADVEVGEGVRVEDIFGAKGEAVDVEDGLLQALWEKETRRVERELADKALENAKPEDVMEE